MAYEPNGEYNPQQDVDWLAFCFVARELGEAEQAAFEGRLAEDQQAREAVALAVQLTEAVSAVCASDDRSPNCLPTPAVGSRYRWLYPVAWMAAGAASLLLVIAAGVIPVGNSPMVSAPAPSRPSPAANNDLAVKLAVLWSQTRDDVIAQADQSWRSELQGSHAEADEPVLSLSVDEGTLDRNTAPSWMLAAVSEGLAASPMAGEQNRPTMEN